MGSGEGEAATGRQGGREVLLCEGVHDAGYYRRGVLTLSLCMLGVFGGFQAAQGLQTSLNATLGFINLGSLYAAFTLLCLAAPAAISRLDKTIGLRVVMFLSSLAYVAMIVSNINVRHWALPIALSVLVGVTAPLIWTCQSDYLGRCAYHAAKSSRQPAAGSETGEDTSLEAMTTKFNSLFFSIYQFAGMSGNVLASALMLAFAGNKWLKDVLFFVLGGVSLIGAVCFLSMPRVGPADGQAEVASLKATAALAATNWRMALMIPLIFTNGMSLAFILGDYPQDVVCPVLGQSFTGFAVATFFGANAFATVMWGKLVSRSLIRRRSAYVIAMLFQLAFFVAKLLWRAPRNYEKHGGEWQRVGSAPSWLEAVAVFLLVALFAGGESFWESGVPATLQNFFLGTTHAVPAMANYKMWQSLGFATQFFVGAELGDAPGARALLLVGLLLASTLALLALDRKAPLQ